MASETTERPAFLHLDSWAGRTRHRVTVIGETPKRYRVRYEEEPPPNFKRCVLPKGEIGLVPKYAITFE